MKTTAAVFLKLAFLICGTAALFSGTACRMAHAAFHPDHGVRQIAFPHGSPVSVRNTPDGLAFVGNGMPDGYAVSAFDVSDPDAPKFLKGIPFTGGVVRDPAFLSFFGFYPSDSSVAVISLTRSMSFHEKIPGIREPGKIRILAGKRRLYVPASDGLRIYDISVPSRPVMTDFQEDIKDLPDGADPRSVPLFCPAPDAGIVRVEAKSPRTLILPDGTRKNFPDDIADIFESKDLLHIYAKDGNVYDTDGNKLFSGAIRYRADHDGSRFLTEMEKALFYTVSVDGKRSVWRLPEEMSRPILDFHSSGNRFLAAREDGILIGTMQEDGKNAGSGSIRMESEVPFVRKEGGLCADGEMVYAVSRQEKGFLIYGFNYRYPPFDGTPFDFAFRYVPEKDDDFRDAEAEIRIIGDRIFAPGVIIGLSAFSGPRILQTTDTAASRIRQEGDRLYTFGPAGKDLTVYDVSALPEIRKIGTVPANALRDLAPAGETGCCLTDAEPGKLNMIRMETGEILASLDLPGVPPGRMLRTGNYLYLLPSPAGQDKKPEPLRIVDIRDPKAPFVLKEWNDLFTTGTRGAVLVSDLLFATDGDVIRRFDVSHPEKPVQTGVYRGKDMALRPYTGLEVAGKTLIGIKFGHIDIWDDCEKETAEK